MMRAVLRTGAVLLAALLPGASVCACAKAEPKAQTAQTAAAKDMEETSAGPVVLLWTDGKLTDKELQDLLSRYDLSLVYDYENFDAYALQANNALTDAETDKLLSDLSKEPRVLQALPDEVVTLDGTGDTMDLEEAQ